jgi:hypothetical protein
MSLVSLVEEYLRANGSGWPAATLHRCGFLLGSGWPVATDELRLAMETYRLFHGLPVTLKGEDPLDAAMLAHLLAPRCCAKPDVMALTAPGPGQRWPKNALTYWIDPSATFGQVTRALVYDAFTWAWEQWAKAANVRASRVEEKQGADLTVITGQIGGPWGTVAETQMPDGSNQQRWQRFNCDSAWRARGQGDRFSLDLGLVALHEIGHAIGIPHLPGSVKCIMDPIYHPDVCALREPDVGAAQALYPAA